MQDSQRQSGPPGAPRSDDRTGDDSPSEQRGGAPVDAEQGEPRGNGQESGPPESEKPPQDHPSASGQEEGGAPARQRPGWLRSRAGLILTVVWTICGVLVAAAAAVYLLKQFGLLGGESGAPTPASSLLNFQNNRLWVNFVIFAVAAVAVWMAGTKVSSYADLITDRTGLSSAFAGLLLLSLATSLPEVATTVTASVIGNASLVIGNLLGGGVMQIAILAALDLLLVRGALTYFAPKPVLMINGVMVVGLLTVAIMGIAVGSQWSILGVGPWGAAIFLLFLLMLWMTHAEAHRPAWRPTNPPSDLDGSDLKRKEAERYRGMSNRRLYLSYAAGALAILLAGFVLTRVADAIDKQTGLGGTLIGAVLLSVATSLPEISTTSKALRLGAYSMAVSSIFGSAAFNASLLFLGDLLYREGPLLDAASPSGVLLAGMGILMTCTYLWGLLERKDKTILRMGIDSAIILVIYFGGMVVLYRIS